jgi:hypothetical protein
MSGRDDLQPWIVDALRSNGGQAKITEVARYIWQHHQRDLRSSGELFYEWQYEMRWAAGELRRAGRMKAAAASPKGIWVLAPSN